MTSLARILPGREPWEDEDEAEDYVDDPLPRWIRKLENQVEPLLQKCQPTTAEPGSAEKLAILEARFAAGESLWNEDDPWNRDSATGVEMAAKIFEKTWRGVETRHTRSYRANPWDGTLNRHVHLGYHRTKEEAVEATRKWRSEVIEVNQKRLLRSLWSRIEQQMGKPELVNIKQAASMLGVTEADVDALRRCGLLNLVKTCTFRRDQVLDVIDEAHRVSRETVTDELSEVEACLEFRILPDDLKRLADASLIDQPFKRSQIAFVAENTSEITAKLIQAIKERPTMTTNEIAADYPGLTHRRLQKLSEVGLLPSEEPYKRDDVRSLVTNAGQILAKLRKAFEEVTTNGKV